MAEVACFYETESYWSADWIQYLIKASHQALRLLDDAALYTPLHHALDVLLLILLWHGDICTARLQLALCDLTHTHVLLWDNAERLCRLTQTHTHTLTCPNTSSLTVKVRSSMSSMSLSFIHWRLWWNSSSRYSRSLRSHGLHTRINKYMWTWSNDVIEVIKQNVWV